MSLRGSTDKEGFALASRPDEVNERLAVIVCTCRVTDTPGWTPVFEKRPPLCKKCEKLPRYLVRTCRKCGVLFAKDFKHPNYRVDWPCCWDCVQELTAEDYLAMGEKIAALSNYDRIIAPPYMARKLAAYDNYDPTKTVFSF